MTYRSIAVLTLALLAVACGSETAPQPEASLIGPPATIAPPTPTVPSTPGHPMVSAPPGSMTSGFSPTELTVKADKPFELMFTNDDPGVQHNVQILDGTDIYGDLFWAPKDNALVTGVASVTYKIPAMDKGAYTYNCYLHPTTMMGTITAE